jgi:hypothetical protein
MVSLGGVGSLGSLVWVPAEVLARTTSFILALRLAGGICLYCSHEATMTTAAWLQRGLVRITMLSSGGGTITTSADACGE